VGGDALGIAESFTTAAQCSSEEPDAQPTVVHAAFTQQAQEARWAQGKWKVNLLMQETASLWICVEPGVYHLPCLWGYLSQCQPCSFPLSSEDK
jgi:hypothetical protein